MPYGYEMCEGTKMNIVNAREAPVIDTPHRVDVRKLHDIEHVQVVHITLQPGEALKRHITPVDVTFYMLEGRGIVEVGDEKQEVGPDTLIESPKKIPHTWYNESDAPCRFLVIKTPKPAESTRVL